MFLLILLIIVITIMINYFTIVKLLTELPNFTSVYFFIIIIFVYLVIIIHY